MMIYNNTLKRHAIAVVAAVMLVTGNGCAQKDVAVTSPRRVPTPANVAQPPDQIPQAGESHSTVESSSAAGWRAYTLVGKATNSLIIEGPSGFKRIIDGGGDPRPVDFSPDGTRLVYIDSSPIGWDSFFVVDLTLDAVPRILTNAKLGEYPIAERKTRSIPTPPNGAVMWLSTTTLRYGHPYQGNILIDIETGTVVVNGQQVQ